jgi:hypothetical protein
MPFHLAPFLSRFARYPGLVTFRQRFVRRCQNCGLICGHHATRVPRTSARLRHHLKSDGDTKDARSRRPFADAIAARASRPDTNRSRGWRPARQLRRLARLDAKLREEPAQLECWTLLAVRHQRDREIVFVIDGPTDDGGAGIALGAALAGNPLRPLLPLLAASAGAACAGKQLPALARTRAGIVAG